MHINYRTTIVQGLIALFFLFAPLQAAYSFTFTVDNSVDDFTDANAGDGLCNINVGAPVECTLRAAIQEANAWPGADYILVPAGNYQIGVNGTGENASVTGDYDITGQLTINGAGSAVTIIDGDDRDRVFNVLPGATVTISDVTIQNGSSSITDGGGILNQGILTLVDSIVTGNTTTNDSSGGGISNLSTLTISRSAINSNDSSSTGGGIINGGVGASDAVTTINDSIIEGNQASSVGGGINISGGSVTINNTLISSNSTNQNGGGISNQGTLVVNNSTFYFNSALQGGTYSSFGPPNNVTATFTNSTVSGNNASNKGGGFFNRTTLTINNSTVTDNDGTVEGGGILTDSSGSTNAASTTLKQSIISGNNSLSGDNCFTASTSILTSQGYNISGDASCNLNGTGDSPLIDPQLGALASNGGLTKTHMIVVTSPAINKVANTACPAPATDQRGATRPDGGAGTNCDTGAVERIASEATAVDLHIAIDDTPDPFLTGSGNLTYAITVKNQGPTNATGVTLTNILPAGVAYVSSTGGCAEAGGTVTCAIGALNIDSSTTINIVVTPATVGTITNTASASATQTDLNTANSTSVTETTLIITTADLSVNKVMTVPASEPVPVTQNITYQITVTNNGPDAANGIRLIDTLPTAATLVSATGVSGTWTCTGTSTINCDLSGTLAASGTAIVQVVMSPPLAGGTITNTAYVTFDGSDTNTSNNISSLDTDTIAVADILVDITESSDPTLVGADYTYQFNITNNGPSPAANVELTVTLPATLTLKDIGSCSGTTTVTCDLGSLAANTNSVVVFTVNPTVAAPSGTPLTITADITSDAFDTNTANNSATEQTVVNDTTTTIDNADITLVSLFDNPDPVTEGNNLIYTANIRNDGPDTARNVVLTLTLPGSVTFVSSDSTCSASVDGSTLLITCTIGSMALNSTTAAHITATPTVGDVIITAVASVTNTTGSDPDVANNDNNKTQSTQVNAATGTPPPTVGTSSGGGGCFIATAAYGSYLDPHVMVLRKFRDNYLLSNAPGTRLVEFYYATSPPIADFIRQHEAIRVVTRWTLTPMIFGIEYPLGTLMFGVLLIGGINYRRTQASG